MALSDWSTTAADNDTAGSINFAEGQAPSTVNNSARALMADVRTWYEDVEWRDFGHTPTYVAATQFSVTGDKTTTYTVGRRVRIADSSTLYGTISASSYSTVTTVTVVLDSGSVSASISGVAVGAEVTNKSISRSSVFNGVKAVQRAEATPVTAVTTCTTDMPLDTSTPQNTEGDEVITVTITPKSTTNRLVIEFTAQQVSANATGHTLWALFQDSTANALASGYDYHGVVTRPINLRHEMAAGTTSSTTFKIRVGPEVSGTITTVYLNAYQTGTQYLNATTSARLSVTEWEA